MNALVNGVAVGAGAAAVSIDDRGLQYGDGVFETMVCRHGRVRWFERHMERLVRGCERLGLSMPDRALLHAEAHALARSGDATRAILKLVLTRGVSEVRGYRPTGMEQPTRIFVRYPWPTPTPTPAPAPAPAPALAPAPAAGPVAGEFRVHLSPVPLGANPLLAGIKHLNRLEQVLGQRAAGQAGVHEGLQRLQGGPVVCGTMSNLFVALDGLWLTPPIEDCGVLGVMRSLIIECAPTVGLRVQEKRLTAEYLATAPAMVLSNVRLGLQPVHCYEGRKLSVSAPMTALLNRLREVIDAADG